VTTSSPAPPGLVRVVLLADERTTEGGTATTTWRFFDGSQWTPVKDHPHATFARLDCGPGVMWQTRAEVWFAPATWVVRVERYPNRRQHSSDPMEYLRREIVRQKYALRHSFFQVSPNGSLERRQRQDAPLDADAL
jgi:hypothetical protein